MVGFGLSLYELEGLAGPLQRQRQHRQEPIASNYVGQSNSFAQLRSAHLNGIEFDGPAERIIYPDGQASWRTWTEVHRSADPVWGGRGNMTSRSIAALCSGATVVLTAASAFANDRLNAGWPWWAALVAFVALASALTGWLYWRAEGATVRRTPTVTPPAAGAISGGGDVEEARTNVVGLASEMVPRGVGSISAQGNIKKAATNVSFGPRSKN
jgi:hypothetical protein